MHQSKKSKCIVLLPQNCIYLHGYGRDYSAGSNRYLKKSPLKNLFRNFKESPIGELFILSMPICFGESKTILSNRELSSDFSFGKPLPAGIYGILESNASTVSAVLISDKFAATTLLVKNNSDLSAIVGAIFPIATQSARTPDWLEEVEFHDETTRRVRMKDIDDQITFLSEEIASKMLV